MSKNSDQAAHLAAELLRIKNRFDTIFNNVLCDMKPGWDDSIEGFNKAWGVASDIFQEEIGRATASALSSHHQQGDSVRKNLVEELKQLRAELAFGADGEAASLVGEAVDAISAIIQKCAGAVVMCPECDCTSMSRKAILALSSQQGNTP